MLATLCSFGLGLALVAAPSVAGAAATPDPRDQMLVSPAWLAGHLQDRNLVLLHIGNRAGYDAGHIPGARFISLDQISVRREGLSLELPETAALDSALESFGVSDDSRIVLYYGDDWVSPTTRVWFTFLYAGLGERTSLLDGGMRAWTAAGHPVTAEPPGPAARGRLTLRPQPALVARADWIREHLDDGRVAVIDARNEQYYDGIDGGQPRNGRLPGARNVPFPSVLDDSLRLLPDTALKRIFRAAGAEPGDRIVAYCHIGQQATLVAFAARLAGYEAVLYDGSFQEWSGREDLPVEGGVAFTRGSLISTADLAAHLPQGGISIVDLRSDLGAYLKDHVPGAVFLHFETLRATGPAGVPADLLSPESYAAIFSRLGLRRDRPVVIYASGDAANFNATFLAWLLAGFRHEQVFLLDGGYEKWAAEGRALTREYPTVEATEYGARPFALEVIAGRDVHGSLGRQGLILLDARPPEQYAGQAGAQMRRGHIPGARSHPWSGDLAAVTGGRTWKSVDELRASYAAHGVGPDQAVIAYCNTGTEASHLYFALRFLLGHQRVWVYVPSFTEWAAHSEWPVTTGMDP